MRASEEAAQREIRAAGPRAGAEALRTAYLELLKLCVCDLATGRTWSVYTDPDDGAFARALDAGQQARLQVSGKAWPLHGLTMVGLMRLDDLQACVERVVSEGVEGDLIEVGAWRGGASILIRATLDSLGSEGRTVVVADSFQGLPRPDTDAYPEDEGLDLSQHDFLVAPLEEVRDHFARFDCERGVRFVPGFFDETLPRLAERRWSLIRLDGDTYESTRVALESLYPRLSPGGFLIVDDYAVPQSQRAVDDFRREHSIAEPLEEVDWTCVRWRREGNAPIASNGAASPQPPRRPGSSRAVSRAPGEPVPTESELRLRRHAAHLRARLRAAEAEIERLRKR